jgi:uncharacterized membrane protein
MTTTDQPTERARQAKHPVSAAAGPYGHPFHPILVTVPIGAWVAALIFDIVSRFADDPAIFSTGAYWLLAIGIVGALAASVFGFMDLMTIPRQSNAFRTGVVHMVLNVLVIMALAISFGIRTADAGERGEVSLGLIALSVAALAALGGSGWLGGKLTYRYGVRVAEEEVQAQEGFS